MSFVDKNRESYGVEPVCRMLPIATSLYYEHKAREKGPESPPRPGQAGPRTPRRDSACAERELRRVRSA